MEDIPAANRFQAQVCTEVTIRCSVQIEGSEVPVTWSKGGSAVVSDGRRVTISGARGEILTINSVLKSDEGIYTCVPVTPTGRPVAASLLMGVTGTYACYHGIFLRQSLD